MADYYVSTSGNNANPGTAAEPWLTWRYAASQAQPGDTVYGRAGTYVEGLLTTRNGTAGSPITFRSAPGETVVLNPGITTDQWVEDSGLYRLLLADLDANPTTGAAFDGPSIHLIATTGRAVSRLNGLTLTAALAVMADPEYVDYDLSFYDATAEEIYLRLAAATDIADIEVVDFSSRVSICHSYITVRGLSIRHSYEGVKVQDVGGVYSDHAAVADCVIRRTALSGIHLTHLVTNASVTGNDVAVCGAPLMVYNGSIRPNNQVHAIYGGGTGGTVISGNSFADPSPTGYQAHLYEAVAGYPKDFIFSGNRCHGGGNGIVLTGVGGEVSDNSVTALDSGAIALTVFGSTGMEVIGNRLTGSTALSVGQYGRVEALTFTDNHVSGVSTAVIWSDVDWAGSDIGRNRYSGLKRYVDGGTIYRNFSAYRAGMTNDHGAEIDSDYIAPEHWPVDHWTATYWPSGFWPAWSRGYRLSRQLLVDAQGESLGD